MWIDINVVIERKAKKKSSNYCWDQTFHVKANKCRINGKKRETNSNNNNTKIKETTATSIQQKENLYKTKR